MDEELITDWFDSYADDIYRFLVYYMSTPDVEDVVQEVFIKAINRYDSFNGKSSPKTWLISIARNLAIDEIRRQKRQDWRRLIKTYEYKTENSPESAQIANETKLQLHQVISKLRQNYRDVIILRGIEELSIAETADILKWPDKKVSLTFHRALKALKKKMEEGDYDT
ncbi:RNA polymerase sigma factor [Virgibacillus kimchii]